MRRDYEPDVSQILALYQQLEDDILASMTKRMLKMGYVSESTKYQAEILQSAGLLREDVAQMIAQRTDASVQQVKALFEDAGVETVRIDNEIYREAGVLPIDIRQDEGMRNLLEEGYRRTLGTMQNLVGTTAAQTEQQFISACDRAYMQVSSGAFSYQEAIMTAVKSFADIGAEVVYPSGHRDKLDVAVRRAVLTGVGQATAAVSLKHADEAGCDLMELSAHSGARPDHAEWQGQLVSRTGKNAGRTIDGLHVYSLDQIGYGTGRGFKGWNCRHNWYPYYEGFSKPNYTKQQIAALNAKNIPYNGQMYSKYEISQMQRAAERKIRKLKRRLITAQESVKNAPDNATRAAAQNYYNRNAVKLKDAEKQLRDFCNQTGQWNDKFRTQVSGFGQSEAQKAVWANKKAQQGKNPPPASPTAPSVPKSPKPKNPSGSAANSLTSSNRSGIINSSDNGIQFHQITDESIKNMKQLNIFKNNQLNFYHQKVSQDLLQIARYFIPGTELSVICDENMKPIKEFDFYVIGRIMSTPVKNPEIPFHAFHNHGSGESFSFTDIFNFTKTENMLSFTAVGNNGSLYVISRTSESDKNSYINFLINKMEENFYHAGNVKFSYKFLNSEAGKEAYQNLKQAEKKELMKALTKWSISCAKGGNQYGFNYATS